MSKTKKQWEAIFKARNERRKGYDKSERKHNRLMGRHLSTRTWDKSANAPLIPKEVKKVYEVD
jgi:hypothetical protein